MDKKITATIIVAIVVIAAVCVAAYALVGDDDNDTLDVDATVLIYGNANNDGRIDSADVELIQSMIDDDNWNKSEYPYADANCDGELTEADIALVNKIINKEETTIYYHNYFDEQQAIEYPLVDRRIAVTYWQQAEAVSILGHWDDVVVASRAATDNYPELYPSDGIVKVGTTGSSSQAVADLEVFTENDVDLIIATASTAVRSALNGLANTDIQIVYLWHSGPDVVSTILTLGIMMDSVEQAEAYATYYDEVVSSVEDKIAGMDNLPTIVCNIVYSNTEERYDSNGGFCVMLSDREGAYYLLSKLGNVISDPDAGEWGYAYHDNEWFLSQSSSIDFIINCESGIGFSSSYTQEDYNARFESNAALFSYMDAYAEGKVIGSVYAFLGGFSGFSMLPFLASMIYPDEFSMDDGFETLQYWLDNFTNVDVDVTSWGTFYYTGDAYDIWYNRD